MAVNQGNVLHSLSAQMQVLQTTHQDYDQNRQHVAHLTAKYARLKDSMARTQTQFQSRQGQDHQLQHTLGDQLHLLRHQLRRLEGQTHELAQEQVIYQQLLISRQCDIQKCSSVLAALKQQQLQFRQQQRQLYQAITHLQHDKEAALQALDDTERSYAGQQERHKMVFLRLQERTEQQALLQQNLNALQHALSDESQQESILSSQCLEIKQDHSRMVGDVRTLEGQLSAKTSMRDSLAGKAKLMAASWQAEAARNCQYKTGINLTSSTPTRKEHPRTAGGLKHASLGNRTTELLEPQPFGIQQTGGR